MNFRIVLQLLAILCVSHAEERIIGGDIAQVVHPYQVSLRDRETGKHFCSGSIINKNVILTAAHCFMRVDLTSVHSRIAAVVGTKSLSKGGVEYAISMAIPHEKFDTEVQTNDIAILRTATPITFNKNIKPIQLYMDEVPPRSEMLVAGWGRTSRRGNRTLSENLQYLHVYLVDTAACNAVHQLETGMKVHQSDLCAMRSSTQGTCTGDSGGPLVYEMRLAGIVSRGGYPCARGVPDIYTKVAAYADWIDSKLKNVP